ncbi:MotA/TolQ/ExbB proton channel family protein [Persicobacter psychrovividus]|uniref:Biopolymer transporter ExbB n=1 Tax=Persicobacter psychrovividus TaxID=387638 RepID=A0ABM7VE53_9BACT|nr:biopolymer transporter ExbB [Persicobacter psychrovividus]
MLSLLFQQISTTTEPIAADVAAHADSISLLDLVLKGGWMMIPLALLLVGAIYIIIERYMTLISASKLPKDFNETIRTLVMSGEIEQAKAVCRENDSPVAKMIEKGISRIGNSMKNIEASIENVGKIQIYRLEKNLSVLATISGAAPMMGFLGTVTGMISAFIAIAQEQGSVSPKLLSSGIYEAMITTAFGLLVGLIAYLGYNFLVAKVQKLIQAMEYNTIDFIDLLQEPQNKL